MRQFSDLFPWREPKYICFQQCSIGDQRATYTASQFSRTLIMAEMRGQNRWVYLDNNATTRTDPRVVEAMLPFLREEYANPSSQHDLGVAAKDAVRAARSLVGALIGAERESEIVFTSGGSESNTTAILSALETQKGRNEIVTSVVEHPAVLALCAHLEHTGKARVHRIPVDSHGNLILDAYRKALSEQIGR